MVASRATSVSPTASTLAPYTLPETGMTTTSMASNTNSTALSMVSISSQNRSRCMRVRSDMAWASVGGAAAGQQADLPAHLAQRGQVEVQGAGKQQQRQHALHQHVGKVDR
jgi:hypothetical protein